MTTRRSPDESRHRVTSQAGYAAFQVFKGRERAGEALSEALLVARLVRLGFLASFLSRTVLVGFLTGVGVEVAASQAGELLGIDTSAHGAIPKLVAVARNLRAIKRRR